MTFEEWEASYLGRIKVQARHKDRQDAWNAAVADREERILVLEARNTLNSEALQTQNGRACLAEDRERTLQARIERAKGLANKTFYVATDELLAALDGEPPSTATIVHAGPLKMKPIEPEPKERENV